MNKYILFVSTQLLLLSIGSLAVEPLLRVYFVLPVGDGHLNFADKFESDIYVWESYLDIADAYCWTGWWQIFDSNNSLILNTGYSEDLGNCDEGAGIIPNFYTGRFLGPNDTDTVAIAVYAGQNAEHFLSGEEFVIEEESASEFPFQNLPSGLVTFGHSNWTLYSGKNFTGNSTCFESQSVVDSLNLQEAMIQVESVKLGCN